MSKSFKQLALKFGYAYACGLLLAASLSSTAGAAERPTLNHYTRDPRPDILVHPVYDAYVPYRRQYNRPRFWGGWVAAQIAPSSLEAMSWEENLRAGRYDEKHMPPMCKYYYAPKPWEVLATGARPDRTQTNANQPMELQRLAPSRENLDPGVDEPNAIPEPIKTSAIKPLHLESSSRKSR